MFKVKNIKPPPDLRDFIFQDKELVAEELPTATLGNKVWRLKSDLRRWAKAGFPRATRETRKAREAICDACPEWDPQGNLGLGQCRRCGCTKAKLYLATSKCPDGKWSAEELQE